MKGKPLSTNKMRDKHYPLTGLWSGDDLFFCWEPVGDLLGQVPRIPEFLDVFLRDGGIHPLALRSKSVHGWSTFWEQRGLKLGRWSLRTDGPRKGKAWGKKGGSYLLIKAVNIMRPPRALKLAYFQGVVRNGTVGFPKPV